MKFAR